MNLELIDKVVAALVEEPNRLDMNSALESAYDRFSPPACNTVGCFAGWTLLIVNKQENESFQQALRRCWCMWVEMEHRAGELLEITPEEASRLFHVRNWPLRFKQVYFNIGTAEGRVEILKKRVEHFKETHQ